MTWYKVGLWPSTGKAVVEHFIQADSVDEAYARAASLGYGDTCDPEEYRKLLMYCDNHGCGEPDYRYFDKAGWSGYLLLSDSYAVKLTPAEVLAWKAGLLKPKHAFTESKRKSFSKPLFGSKLRSQRTASKDVKPFKGSADYTKYSAVGFPIYKIWESFGQYCVLSKNPKTGEWIFGRRYDLDTGIWGGGTYRLNIDDLYERCPPYGKLVVDNKRGNTGKY